MCCFFQACNTGDDKEFPCTSHTHTYTPHSCPPHTRLGTSLRRCSLWKQLLSRPQPHPAGNGHVPGLSAPRPTDLTQGHLYLEPSNKDLHLGLPCPDLALGKGEGTRRPFSPLGLSAQSLPCPGLSPHHPLAHSPWDRRDLLSRALRGGRHAQGLRSSPWPSPCCTMLGSGTGEGPRFLQFGPLVLLQLSNQRIDCYFHLAFKKTLLKKKKLYWSKVALQCCASFYCKVNKQYTYAYHVWLFVTLWIVARQALPSTGFFRLYLSGLPIPLLYIPRPWCWGRLKAKEEGSRGWDGWMASPTQWTWTWANSGR